MTWPEALVATTQLSNIEEAHTCMHIHTHMQCKVTKMFVLE